MDIQLVADYNSINSEGPLWHAAEQRLYWTDIETGRMFWYDPAVNHHEQCYTGDKVGGFTIQADGTLLLFRSKGNVVTFKDGQVIDTIIEAIPEAANGRFNDVIADPAGRVFAGTIVPGPDGKPQGKLYRIDLDGTWTEILGQQACPNGMAFSKDRKTFYYTSSGEKTIWQFDYNQANGQVTNKRTLLTGDPADGTPDGMTIDDQDHFWSARWGGSCVIRYAPATPETPQAREVSRIHLPCTRVSCVTFGGPDYTDIYLSTAGADDRKNNGATAGSVYRVTGHPFKGRPEYLSRIGLVS